MGHKKHVSKLEKTLPRGSWLNDAPELSERDDIDTLIIEVSQPEADLTGVLGRKGRALSTGLRMVDAQFVAVDKEFRRPGPEVDIARLRSYVEELRAAYREYVAERTTGG